MPETTTPWLDNYPPGVPEHVDLPKASLAGLLEDAARDFPTRRPSTSRAAPSPTPSCAQQARRFSGVLAGLGVGRGTRVGLILPNSPQAVVALFGALRLGATVVQNNPLYTERELGHQLADAGVEVLVCLDLVYDRVKALRSQTAIREVIVTSVLDELPGIKRVLAPYTKKGKAASAGIGKDEPVKRWREVLGSAPDAPEAGRGRRRPRPGPAAVHRRHHRGLQGRDAHPRQPPGQRRAGAGLVPRRRPGPRGHDGRAALLPRLRADRLPAARPAHGRRPGAAAPLRPRRGAGRGRQVPADAVPGRAHHVRGHQQRRREGRPRPVQHQGLPVRGGRPAAGGRRAVRALLGRAPGRGLRPVGVLAGGHRQPDLRQAQGRHHRHADPRHPGPGRRPRRPFQDHAGGRAGRAGPGRAAGDAGLLEPARRDGPGAAGTAGCSPGTWR